MFFSTIEQEYFNSPLANKDDVKQQLLMMQILNSAGVICIQNIWLKPTEGSNIFQYILENWGLKEK